MDIFNKNMITKQRGMGLLEVLIAVVVTAIGLFAVVNLQTNLMENSSDSKLKAEAMAIAEARLEELRNYTNDVNDKNEFDTAFADTAGAWINSTNITGNNAAFTRSDSIDGSGDAKNITVRVAWTDRNNQAQSIELDTSLSWQDPKSAADLSLDTKDPQVPSPTGRARLGEGKLPTGVPTISNADGTVLYNDGSGDLKLALGDQIVLTLEDACQSNGTCLDFVTINGRIYIDTASTNVTPNEVLVAATDAAFCQRYFIDDSANVVTVTSTTTSAMMTTNGDYEYFDYRCYLGGGWHGNVGIIMQGGISQSDKICLGDPNSAYTAEQPVITARRVYRGMLYKIDGSTTSGKQEDADGDVVYYTVGIADGTELPDSSTSDPTHDFVISSMAASDVEGTNCTSQGIMVRTDSYVGGVAGALFSGQPADFYCLNPNKVDIYDSGTYGIENSCPFDPSDPPLVGHILSGTFEISSSTSLTLDQIEEIAVNTSDGPGNCSRKDFALDGAVYSAAYTCNVYDWGSGWDGSVDTSSSLTSLFCLDDGSDGLADQQINFSNVTSDVSSQNFACETGNNTTISGEVTTYNFRRVLSGVSISAPDGSCSIDTDGLGYSCTTGLYTDSDWSGTITFTTSGGLVCGVDVNENTGVATISNAAPGTKVLNLDIINKTPCP